LTPLEQEPLGQKQYQVYRGFQYKGVIYIEIIRIGTKGHVWYRVDYGIEWITV